MAAQERLVIHSNIYLCSTCHLPHPSTLGSRLLISIIMSDAAYVITWHYHEGVLIAIDCKNSTEGTKLKDFKAYLDDNERPDIAELKEEVEVGTDV